MSTHPEDQYYLQIKLILEKRLKEKLSEISKPRLQDFLTFKLSQTSGNILTFNDLFKIKIFSLVEQI